MSDTVRNIVLRLSIQQAESSIKPPDIAPVQAAVKELRISEEARLETLYKQQTAVRDQAAELRALQAEERAWLAALNEAVEESKRAEEIKPEGGGKKNRADESREAVAQLNREAEAINKVQEGAFRAARGMALLAGATEEDTRALLEMLAVVQGVSDIFRGTTQIITGASQAMTFMTSATNAQTASQALLQSAYLRTAAAAGVFTVAVLAGMEISRRIRAEEEREMAARREKINLMAEEVSVMAAVRNLRAAESSRLGGLQDEKNRLIAEREGYDIAQKRVQAEKEIAKAQEQQAAGRLQAQIGTKGGEVNDFGAAGIKIMLDGLEREIGLQKGLKSEVEQTIAARERELQTQNASVEAAQRALDQERGRLKNLDAIIGRLDEAEQGELERLNKKLADGGQLSRAEIKRADALTGGAFSDTLGGQAANLGKAAGGADKFFGGGFSDKPLTGEGSKVAEIETALAEAKAKQEQLLQQLGELQELNGKALDRLLTLLTKELGARREYEEDVAALDARRRTNRDAAF